MTDKPIKLHWSSSKPNFGDCLSPLLVERLSGRTVKLASPRSCDLVALGSLLHRFKHNWWNKRVHVWGTGFIEAGDQVAHRHYYHALRGELSQNRINGLEDCVLGDPGLLSFMLLDKMPSKQWKLGLITHYEDANSPLVKELIERHPHIKRIDIMAPVQQVLNDIARCEVILSSAMHGLIAADSLGVPNAWIELSNRVRGAGYKFADYYSAFGLEGVSPLTLSDELVSSGLDTIASEYQRPNIDLVKQKIADAFPFKKTEI
ncbi:polysaccharide pyruvyl transferase family protein [Porticoccaceae bacterium LTM1]|nr:polysaccharide pyruvyl transferase family protein [Porticoccaceae bacterium LTM1]